MASVRLGAGQGKTFAVEIWSDASDTAATAEMPGADAKGPWQRVEIPRHATVNDRAVFRDVLEAPAGVAREAFEVAFATRRASGETVQAQGFGRNFKPFQLMAQDCYDPNELRPLPDGRYRSHDCSRPRAPIAKQPLGDVESMSAPADAKKLFDESTAGWESAETFGPCELYVEYRIPADVELQNRHGQHRGNSGVMFVDGKNAYEVQILDSFCNPTYADGEAGGIYGQFPPDVNAARPAGVWQSLRVRFSAPTYRDGELAEPARLSAWLNGVQIHDNRELFGPTAWKKHVSYSEAGPHGPRMQIRLQNHGEPIDFRNAWVRPL